VLAIHADNVLVVLGEQQGAYVGACGLGQEQLQHFHLAERWKLVDAKQKLLGIRAVTADELAEREREEKPDQRPHAQFVLAARLNVQRHGRLAGYEILDAEVTRRRV